jgi:metallo-beta-lactamase family protein
MNAESQVGVTLFGAAGDVTGSAYQIRTGQAQLLVDFGMFQGGRRAESLNRIPQELAPRELDAVLLTHAHLDHTGRLPLLVKAGFAKTIYATPATIELTSLILRDSAKVQAQDAERHNRKLQRAGEGLIEPMYSLADVEQTLRLLRPVPYGEEVQVAPGVTACFAEAGHMLGSSSILLHAQQNGTSKRIGFSGDLGPIGAPILRDFDPFTRADAVFLESTYGDRDHRPFKETVEEFFQILEQAVERKGKVLVPTFAVGRAQTLSVLLSWAFENKVLPPFPVFLDSPMAIEAWKAYAHHPELFDEDMNGWLKEKPLAEHLSILKTTATADESRKINDMPGTCLVMAGAGMCTAGRILHHLRNNLWKPETTVVIVGFQSHESLGRQLVDRANKVSIFGEKVAVKASIHTLNGFSAHAGQTDLLKWFSPLANSRPKVILTHGESKARLALAAKLQNDLGIAPLLPGFGDTILC